MGLLCSVLFSPKSGGPARAFEIVTSFFQAQDGTSIDRRVIQVSPAWNLSLLGPLGAKAGCKTVWPGIELCFFLRNAQLMGELTICDKGTGSIFIFGLRQH